MRNSLTWSIYRTDKKLEVLAAYIVNTGLLTSICSLCVLITVGSTCINSGLGFIIRSSVRRDAIQLYFYRILRKSFETYVMLCVLFFGHVSMTPC